MKNLLVKTLTFSIFLFSSYTAFTQIVGGREPGEVMPHVEEPTPIEGGEFVGNVSLFSGAYQGNHSLGTVSTQGGLSYSLDLSYTSSFA